MCDIDLNFFESTTSIVIANLLQIDLTSDDISSDFSWYSGIKNRAHGGFVRQITDTVGETGFQAFILPKIKKESS